MPIKPVKTFKVGKSVPVPKMNSPLEQMVSDKFDELFQNWNKAKGSREGIHVSSIIVADTSFCIRQIVLMQHFAHAPLPLHGIVLRIFAQGWAIHQKWQELFKFAGIAEETELTHYHKDTGASFTPDAIVTMFKRRFLIEIKSMNAEAYNSMRSVHKDALVQANMYMHLEGIRQAIILVENKDNQEFKLWVVEYDRALIKKYIKRLDDIGAWLALYKAERKLPARHLRCPTEDTPKARSCSVRAACFAGKFAREAMRREHRQARRLLAAAATSGAT